MVTYSPETLKDVEVDIVLGELVVDAKISTGVCKGSGICHERHGGQETEGS